MPTKPRAEKTKKSCGRPSEIDRGKLLDCAEALFAERGFEGTTTRAVVTRARCNLAMISYYFGGKEGLYQAVLLRHFEQLKLRYTAVDYSEPGLTQRWPEFRDPDQRRFCASFFEIARNFSSGSPVKKILLREMMTDAAKMAAAISKSEGSASKLLAGQLRELQKRGRISADVDINFATLGLIGPLIYGCIAGSILKSAYGIASVDEEYIRRLCVHQTRTFFEGWGTTP